MAKVHSLNLGEEVFDDYWMNYLTGDMARSIESRIEYNNIQSYLETRGKCFNKQNL